MKFLWALISLWSAGGLSAAAGVTSTVSSLVELKAKGVTFHRQQLQTPGASVEIETIVASGRAVGRYEFTECIVLKEGLSTEQLASIDAAAANSETVARRSKSATPRSVFLVRGKEIANTYFAFEFSSRTESGAETILRYLIPVSAVKRTKADPPTDPVPTTAGPVVPPL